MSSTGKGRRRPVLGFIGLLLLSLGLLGVCIQPSLHFEAFETASGRTIAYVFCVGTSGLLVLLGAVVLVFALWTGHVKMLG